MEDEYGPEPTDSSRGEPRKWKNFTRVVYILGAITTLVTLISSVVLFVPSISGSGDDDTEASESPNHRQPESIVVEQFPGCPERPTDCEIVASTRINTPTGIATAYGVNAHNKFDSDAEDGWPPASGVVILDSDNVVRWVSDFSPGYGLLSIESDVTNNLFVSFAITNHTGAVWVIHVTNDGVDSYGTIAGELAISSVGDPDSRGVRPLYAVREGSPANYQNDSTSRDVYRWTGDQYEYAGCEIYFGYGTSEKILSALDKSCTPVNTPSIDLDGTRPNSLPPP